MACDRACVRTNVSSRRVILWPRCAIDAVLRGGQPLFCVCAPSQVETSLKEAAVISMGTEISTEDLLNIVALADQVCGEAGTQPGLVSVRLPLEASVGTARLT